MANYNNTPFSSTPFSDIFTTGGFSDFFNELFGVEKSDKASTDKDRCKCCNCKDEEEEEGDVKEKFTVADKNRVMNYTDEDFKDNEKLNDFLNVTDGIIEEYNELPSYAKSFINLTTGYDLPKKISQWQDDAVEVNLNERRRQSSLRLQQEAKETALKDIADENEKQQKAKTKTRELAEKYVDTVVTGLYNKSFGNLSDRARENMITGYENFANWILKQ